MSGRKRTQRRVRNPNKLRRETQERLQEVQSRLIDATDNNIESSLSELVTSAEAISNEDEDIQQLYSEARFLTESDDSAVAYATLSSLQEQGYELEAIVTEEAVRANFVRADSPNDTINVSIDSNHTEDAYEEILDVYGDDDCIDFLDTYDRLMQERGIEKDSQTDVTPNGGGERELSSHRSRGRRETSHTGRRSRR